MEDLLQKVSRLTLTSFLSNQAGSQAVTFAIRSGLVVASNYAFKTLSKFLDKIPQDEKSELERVRSKLQTKILIISPAIDLIELISARGNTSLASTQELTRSLKHDIDEFDQKVENIYGLIESRPGRGSSAKTTQAIKEVQAYINDLLFRIEEAIPLISLALTTSGANLSSSLPDSVSPGRMLQAANYLTKADARFDETHKDTRVGPSFSMILYTIFYATNRNPHAGNADITWKEEYAKCIVSLWRRAPRVAGTWYDYELVIEEDLDDGRYHEEDEGPRQKRIDVSVVTRLFFSASGRLLEIEEANSPVLVLKLNNAFRPSTVTNEDNDFDLAQHIIDKVEWMALEMYEESGDEEDGDFGNDKEEQETNLGDIVSSIRSLSLNPGKGQSSATSTPVRRKSSRAPRSSSTPSLSLLEYLVRLSALQANDQESIYQVHDERISLYLRDESQGARNLATTSDADNSQYDSPQSRRSTPASNRFPRTTKKMDRTTPGSAAPETPLVPSTSGMNLTPWEHDRLGRVTGLRRTLYDSLYTESPLKAKVERKEHEERSAEK